MNTIFAMIFLFGLLVTIHEWGHFIVAKRQGIAVETFSIGFGPALFRYIYNGTVYTISLIPLGGYIKMKGDDITVPKEDLKDDEFFSKSPWMRIKVALAGPMMNYFLALLLFVIVFFVGFKTTGTTILGIQKNSLAQKMGLLAGDKIFSMNGKKVNSWSDVLVQLRFPANNTLSCAVFRNNRKIMFQTKRKNPNDIWGVRVSAKDTVFIRHSLFDSLKLSFKTIFEQSWMTAVSIYNLIFQKVSLKKTLTGPIGIVVIAQKETKKGFIHLLRIMAILSIALGFFNLLPLPLLDGGHIFFYTIEWIFKKPLPMKVQLFFQNLGLILLLSLTFFVFCNDILQFKLHLKIKNWWTKESSKSSQTLLEPKRQG